MCRILVTTTNAIVGSQRPKSRYHSMTLGSNGTLCGRSNCNPIKWSPRSHHAVGSGSSSMAQSHPSRRLLLYRRRLWLLAAKSSVRKHSQPISYPMSCHHCNVATTTNAAGTAMHGCNNNNCQRMCSSGRQKHTGQSCVSHLDPESSSMPMTHLSVCLWCVQACDKQTSLTHRVLE
jgi:hypothetical protein